MHTSPDPSAHTLSERERADVRDLTPPSKLHGRKMQGKRMHTLVIYECGR